MEEKEIDLELLERFIEGQLSNEENAAIEERLVNDPEFNALKEDFESMRDGVFAVGQKSLMTKISGWEEDLDNPLAGNERVAGRQISLNTYLKWAAVLIVGAVGFLVWYSGNGQRNKRVYNEYFTVYGNLIVPNVRGEDELTAEEEAFVAYDNGDYERAAGLFTKLPDYKAKEHLTFYKGLAHMANKEFEQAVLDLKELKGKSGDFRTQATWYLALCYLRLGDREEASKLLNELIQENSSYKDRALEVLNKM